MNTALKSNPSNKFDLKNETVDLLNREMAFSQSNLTIKHLEKMRTETHFVPASRHGIEVICGASCETGAM